MFIVTYKDLTLPKLKDSLEYLAKIPLEIKLSWKIARLVRKVATAQNNFSERLKEILKETVHTENGVVQLKRDEKGEVIPGEWDFKDKEAFEKAYAALLETNVEIESDKITASSLKETKLPPEILFPLGPFVNFDL